MCAATVIATDESIRVSSSIAIAYESVSPPPPPYSSGIGIPISPSSAISATSSYGKRLLAVELLGDRRDLLDARTARTVSRISSCSGERSKFTSARRRRELGDQPDTVAGAALLRRGSRRASGG